MQIQHLIQAALGQLGTFIIEARAQWKSCVGFGRQTWNPSALFFFYLYHANMKRHAFMATRRDKDDAQAASYWDAFAWWSPFGSCARPLTGVSFFLFFFTFLCVVYICFDSIFPQRKTWSGHRELSQGASARCGVALRLCNVCLRDEKKIAFVEDDN